MWNVRAVQRLMILGVFGILTGGSRLEAAPLVVPTAAYGAERAQETDRIHAGAGVVVLFPQAMIVGQYQRRWAAGEATGHDLELVYDRQWRRHRLLSALMSAADRPFGDGLHTFQAAAVYGYRVIDRQALSLALGAGLAAGDLGGLPLIPVPYLLLQWETVLFQAELELITGPRVAAGLGSDDSLWLSGELRADAFEDVTDLVFETAAGWRFAGVGWEHRRIELAGAVPNAGRASGSYRLQALLDLQLLTIRAGRVLDSWERIGEQGPRGTGDGWFLEFSGMIPIGTSES